MRTIKRDIVAAVIYSNDGKILLGKKYLTAGGVYPDCWHIPGGGLELDESKDEAIVREIGEETGINLSSDQVRLIDDLGRSTTEKVLKTGEKVLCNMSFFIYEINLTTKSGETAIKAGDDLETLMWVAPEDLKDIKLTPPSVELFTRLKLI